MSRTRFSRRGVLQLFGGSALAAALPASIASAPSAPLRFGIQTTIWGAVALVAEAEKTFEKAGVLVTVNKFSSGAAARDAMIAGHINIVSIGATPFVIGVARNNLVAVGTSSYAGGTLSLVVGKRSGINTVGDLKGKRIASEPGSQTDHVFQNKVAPRFGLRRGDFQIVNIKFEDHVSALASGSVEAFAGVEPNPSRAEVEGIGTILADFAQYDIVPVLLATNHSVLAGRQDDLVKFMRGWMGAVKVCREQPLKAAGIVGNFFRARGLKMHDDVFRAAMSRMDVTPTYRPELKIYLTEMSELLVKQKQLSDVPDLDRALSPQIQQMLG